MSDVIPEDWEYKAIAEIVSLQYGKSPKEVICQDGKYPVIGTGGITGYASDFLHEGQTTVIGRKGTIDKPSFITEKFWAIDTTYFATQYKQADPKWFYYALSSLELAAFNEASGVPSLNRDTLYAIPLSSPPLPEQQKIATILSSVDDVIEKTRAQIDKLKDLKAGMMQELLTQGIGHTEFKNSSLGMIPKAWSVQLLDRVARRGSGHTPSKTKADYWDGGIKWVSLADSGKLDRLYIRDTEKEISTLGIENSSAVIHPSGTVVMSRDAGIGKSAILACEMAVSQHFMAWICSPQLDSHFLYYLLQHWKPRFEAIAMGSTIKTIGLPFFKSLEIPVPQIQEQSKIASVLRSIDLRIFALESKHENLDRMKKALMQDLLTGKVRVKLDPTEVAAA